MGSCLCLRISALIAENEDVATVSFESAPPYKWAVINPRPSLGRLLRREHQHQVKQLAPKGEFNLDPQHLSTHPSCAIPSTESHRSLTCLDVLEAYSRKSDDLDTTMNFFEQKWVSSQDKSASISPQVDGSPPCVSRLQRGDESEHSCLEDQRSSLYSNIYKSESTFSHITAELGESDESSLCGSPQMPLLQEKLVHHASKLEPKICMFSPKYGKLRSSKRLSKKYWTSERETLLQKSLIPEQCRSF